MIGFDQNTRTTPGGQYIDDAGAYHVTLAGAQFGSMRKDGGGDDVLQLFFRTADGRELPKKAFWAPKEDKLQEKARNAFGKYQGDGRPDKNLNRLAQMPADAILTENQFIQAKVAKAWEDFAVEVKHALDGFIAKENLVLSGDNYADFSLKIVALVNNHIDTAQNTFRWALIQLNDRNYTEFPKFVPFFFESDAAALAHAAKKAYKMNKTEASAPGSFGPPAVPFTGAPLPGYGGMTPTTGGSYTTTTPVTTPGTNSGDGDALPF